MISRRSLLRSSLAATAAGAVGWGCSPAGRSRAVSGKLLGPSAALGHRLRDHSYPAPTETRQAGVVVAGAGIAGLAAAYALRRAGVRDVLMVDALAAPGGNASWGVNAVSAYPWGAHYVPLVRQDCAPVLELFSDLGIIVDMVGAGAGDGVGAGAARPVYNEYFLSADPQERLWMYGRWQDGFVPTMGASARDEAQFTAFFAATERMKHALGRDGKPAFAIPVDNSSADPEWRELDRITFAEYLRREGFDSRRLLWYADYCCRDDYGAVAAEVSAWAGLHYFASRNGVAANADPSSVVTWPEGNGHLARELAQRSGATFQGESLVTQVERSDRGVSVDYFDARLGRSIRVNARAAVVCLPRFVATRVVRGLELDSAADFTYSPWMVANLTLSALPAGTGQPLAWDNVIYDSPLLGYVVATHQGLESQRSSTVITYYWPLSEDAPAVSRQRALARSLSDWQGIVLRDLLRVHPELEGHIENMDVWVWGHGMIRPTPGFIWGEARRAASAGHAPPVFFAHSDLSGISIFEEAYCRGRAAGELAAREVAASLAAVTT
jgi:glycine/D-amino acid oxidase-like deaminating enzyme